MVSYAKSKSSTREEIEPRLVKYGERMGPKVLELMAFRERLTRRENLQTFLQLISGSVWRFLFGRNADSLERIPSKDGKDECMSSPPHLLHRHDN